MVVAVGCGWVPCAFIVFRECVGALRGAVGVRVADHQGRGAVEPRRWCRRGGGGGGSGGGGGGGARAGAGAGLDDALLLRADSFIGLLLLRTRMLLGAADVDGAVLLTRL